MLAEAKGYLDRAPRLLIYPGLVITLMVLASNLVGDGLRDALDPRVRRQMLGRT
jgi:ABC-type dipeptide/oligopeptide/nickel transport system permease subunit